MLNIAHNKRKIWLAAGITAALIFFVWNTEVFAQEDALGFIGDALANTLGGITYVIALGIGGLFIGIGGLALDITIQELIIKMGSLLKGDYGAGISQIWQIIRDLFNIIFIFSFIFIGIKTILNSDDSGTRRALGHLIVAALFINFSLLIALTIIDFSNIAATQIYNLILHTGGINGAYVDGVMKTGPNSISGAFMEIAGLNSFFGQNSTGIQGMDLVIYSILMMIFYIMTGIIFLFATYHVLYRFVALGIYLILSPVLFLGWVLPNFKSYTDKWLKGLLRQSFFAPAFLFLIYVSLMALSRLKVVFVTGGEDYASIMDGAQMTPNGFTIFIFFAVVIGFLYASVKVGDMMGISGAKTTLNAISKAQSMGRQFVGNATFGAAGGFLQGTVGRRFHNLSESDSLKDAASKRGIAGTVSRQVLKGSRIVGDASFDVRRTGVLGKAVGEGKKGGFKSRSEEVEKKEKSFAKSLDEIGDDDPTVNLYIREKEDLEKQVRELREKREGTQGQARSDITVKINATEQKIKDTEEKIKREKSRRQIGTDADAAKAKATLERFKKNKEELDGLKVQFNVAAAAEDREKMAEIAEKIKEANKTKKELAREAKEAEGSLGYAGVLEKRGFWGSAVLGRVTQQDHDAGKAIRKQYEKAVKKTKEESMNDSLKETIEKSSKK